MATTCDKSIPFVFEVEKENIIWVMAANNQDIYAGTGSDGIVLKTRDRIFWSELLNVDDVHVKSLYVSNNQLFIGTAPQGKIYILDLDTEICTLSQQLGNVVYGFVSYNNNLYAAGGNPTNIYIYNTYKNRWDIAYTPYTSVVTKMLIFNNKLYVFFDDKNFVSFDGTYWTLQQSGMDNIASVSNLSTNFYSEGNNAFIVNSNVQSVALSGLTNEEIYDVYPSHYSRSIKSADVDGNSLVIGSSEYGKVYNYFEVTNTSSNVTQNLLYPIFQTESDNTVHYLLNLDTGVNLAAIDNKLYLVYCGAISSTSTTTTLVPTLTSTTTTLPSIINVITPIKGQQIVIGDTVNITWISSKGVNDAIEIDLYQGNVLNQVINAKTTNSGSYQWQVPNNIIPSNDFKIVVTWLTTSSNPINSDFSDIFSIFAIQPTTTTTTTTPSPSSLNVPDANDCRGIPLLVLPEDEYITFIMKDAAMGGIIMATSQGRILGCNSAIVNAYLTGDRTVYAEVSNGFGNISNTTYASFYYSLYNKIAEINEDKEIVKYKYEANSTAIVNDRINGVFYSPILSVKNDLDFWKQLIWQEIKEDDTEIIICVRASDSSDALLTLPWDNCFVSRDSDKGYGSTGHIIRELSDYQIKGKYLQFKVIMTSDRRDITPTLLNLMISYSTKFATYFYTTKFELDNAKAKSGFIIANMTVPQHTEVKFGISNTNSSAWEDYTVVNPNKLFSLNGLDNIKIGIKMIAYDENVPEIAEFALMSGLEY